MYRNSSASNAITLKKWIPQETSDITQCFNNCFHLRKSSNEFIASVSLLLNAQFTKHSLDVEELCDKLDKLLVELQKLAETFGNCYQMLMILKKCSLLEIRVRTWTTLLTFDKNKVTFYLENLLQKIIPLFTQYGTKILILTFQIAIEYNSLLNLDTRFELMNPIQVTSNTCPYLFYPQRKFSITRLLQVLATNRAELCAHKLIDCLLETYKACELLGDSTKDESDNSSLEIYKALTNHMTFEEHQEVDTKEKLKANDEEELIARDILTGYSCDNLQKLLDDEEHNVVDVMNVAVDAAPQMLGSDAFKDGAGSKSVKQKALQKVVNYYQDILWSNVGNYLEHIILWWGPSPLAARSPHSSQHLREWITQYTATAQIPAFIIATLNSLVDGLGVHVTLSSWDKHFRCALVHSAMGDDPLTGPLFSEMLQDLVNLSNQCEVTHDWIIGAPLEDLPLVEQIPILHRLDHSIHTTRLWAATETKKLANNWNVESFFKITHCDIINCLKQLSNARLTDHTLEIEKGGLDVHVEVCAKMRQKLISEVQINIEKLKETVKECVDCLANVCTTISLAHLQMIFPKDEYWNRNCKELPRLPSNYVFKYLNEILTPVIVAIQDENVCNMILRLLCEAWLHHIYVNKIYFSNYGAHQLLVDFGSVSTWMTENAHLSDYLRQKMLRNEVLRRCEGVGRLLLRNPGEKIKMSVQQNMSASPKLEHKELMPAEMYVPNQEQWLELRVGKRGYFSMHLPFCT